MAKYKATILSNGKGLNMTANDLMSLMDKVNDNVKFGIVKLPCKIELSVI